MIELVKKHLKKGGYTKEILAREGKSEDPFLLVSKVPYIGEVMQKNLTFYPYERALHVFSEAKRVHDFAAICRDIAMPQEEKITKLGQLMNESHESCDKLYECSSDMLNELTSMACKAGALGSRLTGAGWGGCCVSLVRKTELKNFIESLTVFYTKTRPVGEELWITDDLNHYIFGTQLGSGAAVLDPSVCIWHA